MKITSEKLKEHINRNLSKNLIERNYEVINQDALNLLTPERFDLLAKYIYIQFKELNIQSNFGEEIYLAHINAFNGFIENDESNKVGKDAFLKSFDNLISSMKNDGVNQNTIIPLSNNIILDGAHRTATAMYFKKSVQTVELDMNTPNFNYSFFKSRGLSEVYLDFMATKYIELKENVYTIILWPSSGGGKEKELQDILKEYGEIVYRKELKLKNNAPVHLVKQAYKTENWLGTSKDGFIGAQNKAKWCFEKDAPVRVILFESNKNMIEMKDEIRALYKIDKHAVHINDTKEEAIELAELLFNKNSIHWMNSSRLKEFRKFNRLFNMYTSVLSQQQFDKSDFLLIGGILAIYGIQQSDDIDYINRSLVVIDFGNKDIELETKKLQYSSVNIDNILYNPKYFFYAWGQKFAVIEIIKEIKEKRASDKDLSDIDILESLIVNNGYKESLIDKCRKYITLSFWKFTIKFYLLKIRFFLLSIKKFLQNSR